MHIRFVATLLQGSFLFIVFMAGVVALSAMLLGRAPNTAHFNPSSSLAFYRILWAENPWETIRLVLIENPLLVVEHLDLKTGLQVWGIFFYTGTLLVYVLVSGFVALYWKRLYYSSARRRSLFAAGVAALLFSVTYLRRVECCGGGPGWVLDTWLLAKVYTPGMGPVDWMLIYDLMAPWLPLLQIAVLLSGILLLIRWRSTACADRG